MPRIASLILSEPNSSNPAAAQSRNTVPDGLASTMSRSGADDAAFAVHATAAPDGPTKKKSLLRWGWEGYENGLSRFVGFTARKSGDLGAFTARRPVLVVVVTLVLSAAICLGWMRYREETSDVLWVPQRGKSVDDRDYVEANYPKSKAGASFYAQLAPTRYATYGGDNAVQLSVTWEMFELHNKVLALTVDNDAGQPVTFWDLCYKTLNGSCDIGDGYLWHWYKSFDLFKTENSATSPVNGNETAFRQRVSQTVYPDGEPVNLLSVFGGTTIRFDPFRLEAAQVIACDYSLDESVSDETVTRWNDAFTDLMKAELPKQQYMTFTWVTGDSVGEELGLAIDNDMLLIFASIAVFIVIAIIFLSKPSMVATRTMLAVLGVFVTALGIVSGWGWGMIFGMPFTPLQKLSPFILLGMGVDVVFILVKSYEIIIQRQPWLPLDQAFRKLMSTAGLSVQVTLLASSVAFALGSVDELASVRWFSAFATLNTLMIMVLMMTLFVGLMVLTERRIRARRWDCCCCVVSKDASAAGVPQQQPPAPWLNSACSTPNSQQAMERPGQVAGMVSDDDVKDENLVKKFFRKFYAPALARWWVKVPIILIFLAWAIASWYGIYQMEYGQPLSDLAPDGSYLQDYDKVQRATYQQQVGEPAALYFRDIDASNPVQQYKMLKAWDLALQDDFVNATTSAFQSNWLVNFIFWVNATDSSAVIVLPENNCYNPIISKLSGNLATVNTPTKSIIPGCVRQDRFYELFNRWSAETGTTSDVICTGTQLCSAAGATILTSRLNFMLIPPANDDLYTTHLIHSMRDLEDEISSSVFAAEDDAAGTYVSFTYNPNWMYFTGDAILPHQALIYFMLALVGVGVVCTFMLVNPVASLLMMVSVGLVVLYLFGELWVLGIKFNQVSIINMIMATGLSVDYSVYFAQKFMTVTADGTGNGRMHAALTDTGSAVFIGGFTALCGTVPMAFAKSVIIRTFFKLIFGTILFALLTGLVLMPVVFSWIPLPPVKSVLVEEQTPPAAAQAVQQKKALQAEMAVQHDMSLQPEINVSCSTTTFSSEERSTV